jgi:ubiquinone/menaquinone biosynthesis C-methylase UbiE
MTASDPTPDTRSLSDHARADIEFHVARAPVYDRLVTSVYQLFDELWLLPFLDRMAAERPGQTVLDVGCGTGEVALHLAARGFDVHATDLSPDMLDVARRKARERHLLDRISFRTADSAGLPYDAATFGGVTSQRMLHHVPDADAVVGEMRRVLKPGGFFYLSDTIDDPTPAARLLRAIWRRTRRASSDPPPQGPAHEVRRKASEIQQLLSAHDLDCEVRFFTYVGLQDRLSPERRMQLIRLLSWPYAKKRGDIFFASCSSS